MSEKTLESSDTFDKVKIYLALARYVKDHYSYPQCIERFRQLTGQPYHNGHDLMSWKYYGGELSDEEFMRVMASWNSSNEFYFNLIKNKGFGPR